MNKSRIVLEFIGSHGEQGVRYTDIQKFICKLSGKDWNEYSKADGHYDESLKKWVYPPRVIGPKPGYRRHHRGIWGTNLTNILNDWCVRNADGRWVLFEFPIDRAVYRQQGTSASVINKAYDLAKYNAWVAKLPMCPGCGVKAYHHKYDRIWKLSGGQVCGTMFAGGYSVDCQDRVWVGGRDHLSLTKLVRSEANEIYEKARYRNFSTFRDQDAWVIDEILKKNASK
jgi:ribosomal protein L37AE/L43A